jgi:PAS domain S-box-containing protein
VTALFETAGELTGESFYMHDFEGRIVQANQRACDTLGYTRAELLTMSLSELEQVFDLKAARAEWAKLKPGARVTVLGHHRRKDGLVIPVAVSIGCALLSGEKICLCFARETMSILVLITSGSPGFKRGYHVTLK